MRSLEDPLGPKVRERVEEAARLCLLTPSVPELKGWYARESGKVGVRISGVRGMKSEAQKCKALPHQVYVHELMIRGNLDF